MSSGPPRKLHGDPFAKEFQTSEQQVARGDAEGMPSGEDKDSEKVPDYDRKKPTQPG